MTRQLKPPDPIYLEMLDLISQGYTPGEAEQYVWDNDGILIHWSQARKHLHDQLGATNDVHAFRRANERGLIRKPA